MVHLEEFARLIEMPMWAWSHGAGGGENVLVIL